MAIVIIAIVFGSSGIFAFYAAVATIPAALLVYWYWRWEFTKAWIDDLEELAEGLKLENDDWRYGLGMVLSLLISAVVKVLLLHQCMNFNHRNS